MSTKNMKKIIFYLDSEAQAILEKIPPLFKSSVVRNMIKQANSEEWLGDTVRDATGTATTTHVPLPMQDKESLKMVQPMGKSECQSFKRLKRMSAMSPTSRSRLQPRPSLQTPRNLRRVEGTTRHIMVVQISRICPAAGTG